MVLHSARAMGDELGNAKESNRSDTLPFGTEFSGELVFNSGLSASFYCSFNAGNQQWANISGTRGYVEVPDFVLPFAGDQLELNVNNHAFSMNGCDFKME